MLMYSVKANYNNKEKSFQVEATDNNEALELAKLVFKCKTIATGPHRDVTFDIQENL